MAEEKIVNATETKPVENKEMLVSTKENKNIHGFGIKSVLKALKNYNGELEWIYDNDEFKITILIPV